MPFLSTAGSLCTSEQSAAACLHPHTSASAFISARLRALIMHIIARLARMRCWLLTRNARSFARGAHIARILSLLTGRRFLSRARRAAAARARAARHALISRSFVASLRALRARASFARAPRFSYRSRVHRHTHSCTRARVADVRYEHRTPRASSRIFSFAARSAASLHSRAGLINILWLCCARWMEGRCRRGARAPVCYICPALYLPAAATISLSVWCGEHHISYHIIIPCLHAGQDGHILMGQDGQTDRWIRWVGGWRGTWEVGGGRWLGVCISTSLLPSP